MARSSTTDQDRVLGLKYRRTNVRVWVEDGDGTLQNISDFFGKDWLHTVEYGEDIDEQTPSAKVTINREHYDLSLARDMEASRLNLDSGGSYAPLLDVGREIVIETAVTPQDKIPAGGDFVEVFRGIIDRVDWGKNPIRIDARDKIGSQLQDLWVEGDEEEYGGAAPGGSALETEMQSILDDWGPQRAGIGDPAINLYTPTSPSWNILKYDQEQTPVMTALQSLAMQIGWVVRSRWDDSTGAFRLTLYEPDRTKSTPDFTFDADDYFDVDRVEINLNWIRNAIQVIWYDRTIAEDDPSDRKKVANDQDNASIAKYGRRWAQLAEDSASNIDTSTEAQAFARAALTDLKEPKATLKIRQKYDWRIQLEDLIRYEANGVHFSSDKDLAVASIRHRITRGTAQTELRLRGQPAGYHDTYEGLIASRGSGLVASTGGGNAPSATTETMAAGGVRVNVAFPDPTGDKDPELFDAYELHEGDSAGFTPSASTLKTRGRQRAFDLQGPPGETKYFKAIRVNRDGTRSAASSAASATYGRSGPHLLDPDAQWAGKFIGQGFGVQTRGSGYEPDFWSTRTGTWESTLDVSTSVKKTGDQSLSIFTDNNEVESDYIPVVGGEAYRFDIEWRMTNTSNKVEASVEWYSDKGTLIGSAVMLVNKAASSSGVWLLDSARATAPSTARWAKLVIGFDETGGNGSLYIDRFEAEIIFPGFEAYLGTGHNLTAATWTQIKLDTENYDLGNNFDPSSSNWSFTAPCDGLYSFSAGALFTDADMYAQLALYKNGSVWRADSTDSASLNENADVRVSVSAECAQLSKGDVITVYARADDSAATPAVSAGAANTWFSGRRVN